MADGRCYSPPMLTLRKHKISRLEEFSDAVFGFALLVWIWHEFIERTAADTAAQVV